MSATLHYLADRLFDRPLLIEATKATQIVSALAGRLEVAGSTLPAPRIDYRRPAKQVVLDKTSGVATYPIIGTLVHRGDSLAALSGVISYATIQNDLAALLADPRVTGILLDIDSGGGEVAGLQELADFLQAARAEKPLWALANTRAASAAYWIASQAERVIVTPHGSVGSIGVFVQHQDVSQAMAKKGIVTSFVFAGKHKIDGNPFEPLAEDVRDAIQERVDALYDDFVAAVASARGISPTNVAATEARMLDPEEAVEAGLADGIGTYGAVLQAMIDEVAPVQIVRRA